MLPLLLPSKTFPKPNSKRSLLQQQRRRENSQSQMSSYSFPEISIPEIISYLSQLQIATAKPEELSNPTVDFLTSLYIAILTHLDPLGDDPAHADFAALELLENPDAHVYSVRLVNLYHKMRDLIDSSCSMNFTLKDLIHPKRDRTITFLSGIINLCLYSQDKLNALQPIVEKLDGYEQRRLELEAQIFEWNREITDHEERIRLEQPRVQELEAEVKELRQTIQNLNKKQMSLKSSFRTLKEKTIETNDKITSADFELVKSAQENAKLRSKIVQSPDKLQRALEEKKSIRTEARNSERSAMQRFQQRNSVMEVYLKAHEKLSKHLMQMQALQEQVNSVKAIDKDVKVLKSKLGDDKVLEMSLEAKIVEQQGKLDQVEESRRAMEKERDLKHAEAINEMNSVKLDMELKSRDLEQRERKIEVMVAEGDNINISINSIRESGMAIQQQLAQKCEEIVKEVDTYSDSISSLLQRVDMDSEVA